MYSPVRMPALLMLIAELGIRNGLPRTIASMLEYEPANRKPKPTDAASVAASFSAIRSRLTSCAVGPPSSVANSTGSKTFAEASLIAGPSPMAGIASD